MPVRKTKGGRQNKIIRYLLFLALVTSVISSATLAKYTGAQKGSAQAMVAAFVTGSTLDMEIPLASMQPGDEQTVTFSVTNYEGAQDNNIILTYQIQLETTGNLPLVYSLSGTAKTEDGEPDPSVGQEMDALVDGTNFSQTHLAKNGVLPPAGTYGRKNHVYDLVIRWPANRADERFSDEIDRVHIRISSEQGLARGGTP